MSAFGGLADIARRCPNVRLRIEGGAAPLHQFRVFAGVQGRRCADRLASRPGGGGDRTRQVLVGALCGRDLSVALIYICGPRFTISLKRSTPKYSASTRTPADCPIF